MEDLWRVHEQDFRLSNRLTEQANTNGWCGVFIRKKSGKTRKTSFTAMST